MHQPEVSLVALRDRREHVIARLNQAYAEDLLEVHRFEDRLARAHSAEDLVTLDALIADLVPPTSTALVPVAPATRMQRSRALFSSVERRGRWVLPPRMEASAVFGTTVLDLREAELEPGENEILVRAVFGSVEIIVPPDLSVDCDGRAIFAAFEHHEGGARPDPSRPRLRVSGSAVFGSVEVKVRERAAPSARTPRALLGP